MNANVISFPVPRRSNDMCEAHPITLPGEKWHVKACKPTRLIVLRDGGGQQTVAEFLTARDAIAAAQCRSLVEDILALPRDDNTDLGRAVLKLFKEYGR